MHFPNYLETLGSAVKNNFIFVECEIMQKKKDF